MDEVDKNDIFNGSVASDEERCYIQLQNLPLFSIFTDIVARNAIKLVVASISSTVLFHG